MRTSRNAVTITNIMSLNLATWIIFHENNYVDEVAKSFICIKKSYYDLAMVIE